MANMHTYNIAKQNLLCQVDVADGPGEDDDGELSSSLSESAPPSMKTHLAQQAASRSPGPAASKVRKQPSREQIRACQVATKACHASMTPPASPASTLTGFVEPAAETQSATSPTSAPLGGNDANLGIGDPGEIAKELAGNKGGDVAPTGTSPQLQGQHMRDAINRAHAAVPFDLRGQLGKAKEAKGKCKAKGAGKVNALNVFVQQCFDDASSSKKV